MNRPYLPGNKALLHLFRKKPFPKRQAKWLLRKIQNLNEPILDLDGISTTYLYEAQSCNNLEAVHLLLERGADPNYVNEDLICDCALWDLQYVWDEKEGEQIRYEIAKLFFEYGADPNIINEDEPLFDWVVDAVFNEMGEYGWTCRKNFLKLLVIYGGGGKGCYDKPTFSELVDKNRIDNYDIQFFRCEDGYHIEGWLVNPDGKRIAQL